MVIVGVIDVIAKVEINAIVRMLVLHYLHHLAPIVRVVCAVEQFLWIHFLIIMYFYFDIVTLPRILNEPSFLCKPSNNTLFVNNLLSLKIKFGEFGQVSNDLGIWRRSFPFEIILAKSHN